MVIYSYKAFANIIDHLIFSTTLEGRQDWYYSHFRDDRNKFRQIQYVTDPINHCGPPKSLHSTSQNFLTANFSLIAA